MAVPPTSRKRNFLPLSTFALLAAVSAAVPAAAQQATTSGIGGPAPILLNASPDNTLAVSDVFLGRNTVGPYMLTWKGIDPATAVVLRGAQRLTADVDYKIDPATGALTFTTPLRNKDIARVDYRYTPGKAQATNAGMMAPMSLKLFSQGNDALTLNAIFRPNVAGAATGAQPTSNGLMLLGFGGSSRLNAQTSLTSKMFLDASGGKILDRSAFQLNEKSKLTFGQFSAGVTRGGSEFKAGDDTGIAAGKQVIEAAGSLNAIHGIAASASFNQTTELPQTGKGATTTVLGQKITGSLGALTRFQATRTDTTTEAADGSSSNRVTSHLQIDQKVGKTTSATAVVDHIENAADDSRTVTQVSTLLVRTQPTDAVTISGTYKNQLLPTGTEDATNVRIEAAATKQIKLAAVVGDRFNKTSALHNREASLEYIPHPTFSLTGSVKLSAEAGKEALATGFSASAKPLKFMELTGGVKVREATENGIPDPTAPDTYTVNLSFGLPKNLLKLTGGYATNPEDERGTVSRVRTGQVTLASSLGQFDLSGGYQTQEDALLPKINTILDLRFGWRFAKTTQITTSYREVQTFDQNLLAVDTYSLSLTHKVGSLLDFSLNGSMTTTAKDRVLQPLPDYRADVKVGLKF